MSEIHLAGNVKYEYTYDSLSRVTKRTLTNLSDNTTSEEVYAYDNAGNITSCTVSSGSNIFVYDRNYRLISYNGLKSVPYITVALDTGLGVYENIQNNSELQQTISDTIVDIGFGLRGIAASTAAGSAAGSIVPGAGTAVGAVVGFVAGTAYYVTINVITIKGKALVDWAKYGAGWLVDKIAGK